MNLSAAEIEEVVREVLLRIQPTSTTENRSQNTTRLSVVEIGERVVATEQLSQIAENTTVRVHSSAIVTPAARDMAVERQIVLEKHTACGERDGEKSVVAVGQGGQRFAALIQEEFGIGTAQTSDDTETAVMNIVSQLKSNPAGRCVLLTADIDIALCLANRSAFVRAISVDHPQRVRQAMSAITANLLILEPKNSSQEKLIDGCRIFFKAPLSAESNLFQRTLKRIV